MPADDGRAANTEAGGRRPKASKERNRGRWRAVVPGALWESSAAEAARDGNRRHLDASGRRRCRAGTGRRCERKHPF